MDTQGKDTAKRRKFNIYVVQGSKFKVYHVKCDACPVKFEERKYFTGEEHISQWFKVGVSLGGSIRFLVLESRLCLG
jgi:hypothetical protein